MQVPGSTYMTGKDIDSKLLVAQQMVGELRKAMKEFCEERGIDTIDVGNISASELFKHAKLIALATSDPKERSVE